MQMRQSFERVALVRRLRKLLLVPNDVSGGAIGAVRGRALHLRRHWLDLVFACDERRNCGIGRINLIQLCITNGRAQVTRNCLLVAGQYHVFRGGLNFRTGCLLLFILHADALFLLVE